MENNRKELAGQLDIIGRLLSIDGMGELLNQLDSKAGIVKVNGIVIQIVSKGINADKDVMDKLAALHLGKTVDEVNELNDRDYSNALRGAVMQDVLGFFGSSHPTE